VTLKSTTRQSAFEPLGFSASVDVLIEEIQAIYQADSIPWVVGYSGGKDSTAVVQLTWMALARLSVEKRHKPVHVITTDTLVENPVVAAWVSRSLDQMTSAAQESGLPITPHRLTPAVVDSFWVNLIGKGYPAPRPRFRWCTERLKIKPANKFITDVVRENGEAIIVLGTRKAESSVRARTMNKYETKRVREKLSPNANLQNSLVYSPIEAWSNDDVWLFLMQVQNPWRFDNKDLLTMYQGASADGECPLVVDTTTPSCGDSRFGCWVCTLVEKDKSMSAMIQNDDEKEWMLPLLSIRNDLDVQNDRHLRDFRRMNGTVTLFNDRPVPGPYTESTRHHWLRRVLEAQTWIRSNGPGHVRSLTLISHDELVEIRRIWVVEKHEMEDVLPQIYTEVTGDPFGGEPVDDAMPFSPGDLALLSALCGSDDVHFQLVRELIDIERRFRTAQRRSGLFGALEGAIRKGFYDDEVDATERATARRSALAAVPREVS
jgi:DNA sulfur modification protein DndC